MKIVQQSHEILDNIDSKQILQKLEQCGRICYKSEDSVTEKSANRFIRSIINRGHESVLEHESITVKFITNRAIANEIVRHRVGSYSQESSRYCNYSKDKFSNEITVIEPSNLNTETLLHWVDVMSNAERIYFEILKLGKTPDQARGVLPLDLKTEIIVTMDIRGWRNFFKQRTPRVAHYQIRELVIPLLEEFKDKLPVLFEDIQYENNKQRTENHHD